jgi:antitoxin MazE
MSEARTVTAEIVSIGNSKGLRIPKGIREAVGLEGEVTLSVSEGALVVRPKRAPRADWRERFAMAKPPKSEPLLIADDLGTDFDSEWTW